MSTTLFAIFVLSLAAGLILIAIGDLLYERVTKR